MSYDMILLSAQACGLAANLWQTSRENKYDLQGTQQQQQQLELRMKQEQLASTQESMANIARLRDVMSTQRAIFAARGQSSNQGTGFFLGQKAIGAFNADEEARELSLGFRQYYNKATQQLMGLEYGGRKTKRNMDAAAKMWNMGSLNSMGTSSINDMVNTIFTNQNKTLTESGPGGTYVDQYGVTKKAGTIYRSK